MRPRNFLAVGFLLIASCASFAVGQESARNPQAAHIGGAGQPVNVASPIPADPMNPRHANAFYLGARFELGPDWLFSPDDDPAYASPAYDDSGWKTVSTNKQLTDYGIHDIPYAWYRIHVHVAPRSNNLAVEVQHITGSYEMYVNGARIGASGKMNGMLESGQGYLTSYDIPDSMIAPNGDLVIAIRFAINRMGPSAVGTSTPLGKDCVFLASRDAAQRDASYEAAHQTVAYFIVFGLNLIVGIVALALYLAMRSQPEYLAISIALLANSSKAAVIIWNHLHGFTASADFLSYFAIGIANVAAIDFVRLIVHLRRSRWLLALEIVLFLSYFGVPLLDIGVLGGNYAPLLFALAVFFVPSLVVFSLLPLLLIWAALGGNRDARLFVPPFAFIGLLNCWNFLTTLSIVCPIMLKFPSMPLFHFGSYTADLWDLWDTIYCVTMLLFLVLRTIGIARRHALSAAELEAARTVQQVLIPEDIPTIPGFLLRSVYKPAGQVGGDFFQILPVRGGGVLAVIGDVSGKGMPAAMTVSLLVGTVRTLAHYTQSPGEILTAMNQRMLARSGGGFTTCLVLRADPSGALTIANAGHLAPYIDGCELTLENGLPLGLSADANYAESTFTLAPGAQLTMLTDGVVEARSEKGELLGFDRLAKLSLNSAAEIADTAKAFGQDDDITVLTLQRDSGKAVHA